MSASEFEKVLKKTVNPGKVRESLVGNGKFHREISKFRMCG